MPRKQSRFHQPAVYNSTPPTLVDGDDSALNVDSSGRLLVTSGTGATDIGKAEDTAHVSGDVGIPAWSVRSDSVAATANDGDYSPIFTDGLGRLWVNVGSTTPGTGATNAGKAVDSVAGATDTGVAGLVVRDDVLSALTPVDGDYTQQRVDSTGAMWVHESFVPVYEDNTAGKAVVEHRYTPSYKLTADTLVKTGAGLLRSATFTCNDAAPTAGSIIIYDNTAESGSELFNHTFTTTPFVPFTVHFDQSVATGIYVGFTTTADVNVFLSYR